MTTQNKVDGLDNLETMYSTALTYIDAITHSERYYTDAQAATRYYDSSNDGAGSTLVCMTLDGKTADELIDASIPSGCIGIWHGSVASVPSGWVLCDGNNDTPDLRGKFIVGAGSHYTAADIGGAATVTTTATITIADHMLAASEIAKHTHGNIIDYYGATSGGHVSGVRDYCAYGTTTVSSTTGNTGGGAAHGHTASYTGTGSQDKRPPYYAACYIMKV